MVEPAPGRSSPAASSEAMIPSAKFEGLQRLVTTIAQANKAVEGGGGFSMNSLLSMDETQKTMPDVLSVLLGAQEHDMYSILERCRLTPENHRLYTNGIHLASHGYGWKGEIPDAKGQVLDLDFTIPILGDSIVRKLRGSVSIDGESRKEFERTTSQWTRVLYEKQEMERQNMQRGIRQ